MVEEPVARVLNFMTLSAEKRQYHVISGKEPEILRIEVVILLFNFPREGGSCLNTWGAC